MSQELLVHLIEVLAFAEVIDTRQHGLDVVLVSRQYYSARRVGLNRPRPSQGSKAFEDLP